MAIRPAAASSSALRKRALLAGYRSGLEETVAAALTARGIGFSYEAHTLRYEIPARVARYSPDFVLDNGIVIETKGIWDSDDRKKIALVREQFPKLDLRLVFTNPNAKIAKGSLTTYASICTKLGIPYAAKAIPAAWLEEAPNAESLALLAHFRKEPKP